MAQPKTFTLVDDFPGTSLNTSNWYVEPNAAGDPNAGLASGPVSVASGTLTLGGGNDSNAGYYTSVNSVGSYDLTGSEILFKLIPNTSSTDHDSTFSVGAATGDGLTVGVTGTSNAAGSGSGESLYFGWFDTTEAYHNLYSVTYNATNHAWMKISESGGTISFATAPDGLTWTTLGTVSTTFQPSFTATNVVFQFSYGSWSGSSSPSGTDGFQSFNSPPASSGGTGGSGSSTYTFPTTVAEVIANVPWLAWYPVTGSSTPAASTWPSPDINMAIFYQSAWGVDITEYGSFNYSNAGQTFLQWCAANSCVPYVELEPWNLNWASGNAGVVPFSTITGGSYDTWLEGIGSAIAAFGKPVILTFAHEFNTGGQYPWSWQGASNFSVQSGTGGAILTPAQWIAGWEYVRNKIRSTAGGWDVWIWAPGASQIGGSVESPAAYWPGSSYVDMVGLDGYPDPYWGAANGTFAGNIGPILSIVRGLGWTKPVFISETNLAQMVNMGGQDITSFVADMAAAGVSGIAEWEESPTGQNGTDFQMTAAQWATYDSAVSVYLAAGVTSGSGSSGSGGSTTAPPSGNPAISTLTDAFPGTALNTSLWTATGATVTVGGGILTIPQNNAYPTVTSNAVYNLQGSMVFVKMTPDLYDAGSNSGLNVMGSSGSVGYGIAVTAGTIYLQGTTDGISGWTTLQSTAYNPTAHAWIAVSESNGSLFFQASPDSITWTTLFSVSDGSFPVTAVQAVMWAGNASA